MINIYWNETLGEQLCTCCRRCEGIRFVPGSQIFATCTAGDGSNSNLDFTSKISKQKHGVRAGKKLTYGAKIRNTANESLPSALEFSVVLPDGVKLLKTKSKPKYRYELPATTPSQGKKLSLSPQGLLGKNKGLDVTYPLEPTYDRTLRTLTWHDLIFPARKGYAFYFKVRVLGNIPAGTDLAFSASIYEELPATGEPYCSSKSYNETVTVVGAGQKHYQKLINKG